MSNYDTPFVQKEMTGALFINKERQTDSQPHAKGSMTVNGVEYWVSAWTNLSGAGVKYQSLRFSPKEQVHNQGMEQAQRALATSTLDDKGAPMTTSNIVNRAPSASPTYGASQFPDDDIPF